MIKRGYDKADFLREVATVDLEDLHFKQTKSQSKKEGPQNVLVFSVLYHPLIERMRLGQFLDFGDRFRPVIGYSSYKNLFRKRYSRFIF